MRADDYPRDDPQLDELSVDNSEQSSSGTDHLKPPSPSEMNCLKRDQLPAALEFTVTESTISGSFSFGEGIPPITFSGQSVS